MGGLRNIAVFTGSRSEYGLLYPILRSLAADERLAFHLIVGGAHYCAEYGTTLQEIEADGFSVACDASVAVDAGYPTFTAESIGAGILRVSSVMSELQPDLLLVYGDRFESFAALIAGTQMNIPVAHIEGGDYTEGGALDDSVRHAMTKLAHLHFTTNAQSAERVLRLGEEPWRVFNIGLPVLDLAHDRLFASPTDLVAEFDLDLKRPVILFCQHPLTTEVDEVGAQIRVSLDALRKLAAQGFQIVATYPNNDDGSRAIVHGLEELARESLPGVHLVRSLGRSRFHGVLNILGRVGCGVVVGNSSAGIKETPAFGCPAVNIGSRQSGRLRASNVVDVGYDTGEIIDAVRNCVENAEFRAECRRCDNPYRQAGAGRRIAEILATISAEHLLRKKMTF